MVPASLFGDLHHDDDLDEVMPTPESEENAPRWRCDSFSSTWNSSHDPP